MSEAPIQDPKLDLFPAVLISWCVFTHLHILSILSKKTSVCKGVSKQLWGCRRPKTLPDKQKRVVFPKICASNLPLFRTRKTSVWKFQFLGFWPQLYICKRYTIFIAVRKCIPILNLEMFQVQFYSLGLLGRFGCFYLVNFRCFVRGERHAIWVLFSWMGQSHGANYTVGHLQLVVEDQKKNPSKMPNQLELPYHQLVYNSYKFLNQFSKQGGM